MFLSYCLALSVSVYLIIYNIHILIYSSHDFYSYSVIAEDNVQYVGSSISSYFITHTKSLSYIYIRNIVFALFKAVIYCVLGPKINSVYISSITS